MTIKEATLQVLCELQKPLSAAELTQAIQEKGLFTFKVDQPKFVVLSTLKRHSVSSHSCAPAKMPCFRELEGGLFDLA